MNCLIEGCTSSSASRGLCGSHYYILIGLVRDGKYTWAQFEEMEMATKSKKGRGVKSDQVKAMLEKKLKRV